MTRRARRAAAAAAGLVSVAAAFAMILGMFSLAADLTEDPTRGLPACATEDATGCYWDAANRENGEGRSFTVDADGAVTYWDGQR